MAKSVPYPSEPQTNARALRSVWVLLYLLATMVVGHCYLHFNGDFSSQFTWFPGTELGSMIDETGQKPYVGRFLIPTIVRELDQLTNPRADIGSSAPDLRRPNVKDTLLVRLEKAVLTSKEFSTDFDFNDWKRPGAWPSASIMFYFVSLAIIFGMPFAARAVYAVLFKDGGPRSWLAGLLFLFAFPAWFHGDSFFYDPATVLCATLLLYAVARARPWLFCIVFVFAMANKETSVLYIPVMIYALWRRYREDCKADYLYYAVLVAVATLTASVLIQTYRINHFATNGGTWLEKHFQDTQLQLFTLYRSTAVFEGAILAIMFYFAFSGFRRKSPLLKAGTLFVFAPLAVSVLAFGRVIEIRALYDAFPILAMLALPTVLDLAGIYAESSLPMRDGFSIPVESEVHVLPADVRQHANIL